MCVYIYIYIYIYTYIYIYIYTHMCSQWGATGAAPAPALRGRLLLAAGSSC